MNGKVTLVLAATLVVAGCIGDTASEASESELETAEQSSQDATQVERTPADVHIEHDFTEGGGEVTFEVSKGTVAEVQRVYIDHRETAAGGVCLFQGEAEVLLEDPSGDVAFSTSTNGASYSSGDGNCAGNDQVVTQPPVQIEPGTWTATFQGQGLGTGHVVLQG